MRSFAGTVVGHYINGQWGSGQGREVIEVHSPSDGRAVGAVVAGTAEDVNKAVDAASSAFPAWAQTSPAERIRLVERLIIEIERGREALASVLTDEMGSPLAFARAAQVGVAVADLRELVAAARAHDSEWEVSNSLVISEPVGVVAAITPWNFPLHQISLKVGAALLAGCTVVLKPSEIAPLNAAMLAGMFEAAGFPPGVFNVVFGNGESVGDPLVTHPKVDMVTFTGSRNVGERISIRASASIKRVTLELGGKSAAVILDDAHVGDSVSAVLRSAFANTGQTCAALTRVLVPSSLRDVWIKQALDESRKWTPGRPEEESTILGPLASAQQLERVRQHIRRAIQDGAEVVTGGAGMVTGLEDGAFVYPTIFNNVTPQMQLFHEEVFGPVLAITSYETIEEAVALANDSIYGLSGGVFSADDARAIDVARQMRTGTVGINGAGLDVGAPFGGYKQSGNGRECGTLGFEEFLETKSVMGARKP
ncbi:aldehyde dehydrogenase family protein [Arthrobacter sp. MYb23]|nr:aldehyde dehydrogenase family protein [Arthrobacter sp. MYb51]PRB98009.1 aldehyde dehydrogenase family protein [Arthrobacter sp. MYb23]